ncbi:hypothetical protein HK098_000938 [Nowakowskiella sp. JEL0407]|nr:hypothetical protein HK098_000938 [Nowakowskiella sp. JEL0407]
MEQHTAMLSATILKGDASYKVTKHIGKVQGIPVFNGGLYTLVNEYEEIRMQTFMPTKSFSHLIQPFNNLQQSLKNFGHSEPDLFFTDNVTNEKEFLLKSFPSLGQNIQTPANVMTHLDTYEIPKTIAISIISNPHEADVVLNLLIEEIIKNEAITIPVIGFDTEWLYNPLTKVSDRTAVVQIAFETRIITKVYHWRTLPEALKVMMKSRRVIKTGRQVTGDIRKLARDFNWSNEEVDELRGIDLGGLCKKVGLVANGKMSLAGLCAVILRKYLPKDDNTRLSAWNSPELSPTQITYAATDAFVSLLIFKAVVEKQPIGSVVKTPLPGLHVAVHPRNSYLPAAIGTIVDYRDKSYDGIVLKGTRIVVSIKEVI